MKEKKKQEDRGQLRLGDDVQSILVQKNGSKNQISREGLW